MAKSNSWKLLIWTLAGLAGAAALLWAYPRVFPFAPHHWTVTKDEATAVALERLRDLGDPVPGALVVTVFSQTAPIEARLLRALRAGGDLERLRDSLLAGQSVDWRVTVYPPGARPFEWAYRARISLDGRVLDLVRRVPEEHEAPGIDPAVARRRADAFLRTEGFGLDDFGEPVVRRQDLQARTDLSLRYPAKEAVLATEVPYGIEVTFAGDELTGFQLWYDIPDVKEIQASLQPINLMSQVRVMMAFLLFPGVAVVFLRRYHAGEVGVRRAVQIFVLAFVAGGMLILLAGASASEGTNFGILSRRQVAWAWSLQIVILWFSVMALVAALSWAVGEWFCRSRWPQKLAGFDALFTGRWANATLARSSFRGLMAGLALAGGETLLLLLVPARSTAPMFSLTLGPWWESASWPGLALLAFTLAYGLYSELFARLFLLSAASRRLGRWGAGIVVSALSAVAFWPVVSGGSLSSNLVWGFAGAAVLATLFFAGDLLTALTAAITADLAFGAMPFLLADDSFLRFQGALPLLLVALPTLVSLKDLVGGSELQYRWEDVPPHVRRIAERERQRVELETARRIQSSILPELPPRLAGVDIAHAYLPASEVGGDFYDVLALEDGRLAVAVGDVAGHGVSSGLVMSMAKSALAVQVSFDPSVEKVFHTLNRTVYQTARKRLLATLCYALIDPSRREMLYASAGHLFPYRIGRDGRVEALESVAYPLGVRGELDVLAKEAHLAAGDTLFLFSDGIVEARREGTDEPFGFTRLEESLRRHGAESVERLRDAVLAEVADFAGLAPREDDFTVLVLRLP